MRSVLYRLRAETRWQWLSWLGVALLIGLIAGPSMALVAGARRTHTVYDRFLTEADPADVVIAESPDFGISKIDLNAAAGLSEVEQAAVSAVYFSVIQLDDGRLMLPGNDAILMVDPASVGDGLNVPRVIEGRLADPTEPTEAVVGFVLARQFGLEVGDTLRVSLILQESLAETQVGFLETLGDRVATPEAEVFDGSPPSRGPASTSRSSGSRRARWSSRRSEASSPSCGSPPRSRRKSGSGAGGLAICTSSSARVCPWPTISSGSKPRRPTEPGWSSIRSANSRRRA